ncbi:hypothetical protein [Gemmatimonas sp.]|uniref:hypothetical protein n=1 Tax=Gemmatimonas sp. TaxID=1962908 RepID=UPI00286E85F7|nr:hypothetical protein [Gemmatimonas sp.]
MFRSVVIRHLVLVGALIAVAGPATAGAHPSVVPVLGAATEVGTADPLSQLRDAVVNGPIEPELVAGLTATLDAAANAVARGKPTAACGPMKGFEATLLAHAGDGIPLGYANQLYVQSLFVQETLGC